MIQVGSDVHVKLTRHWIKTYLCTERTNRRIKAMGDVVMHTQQRQGCIDAIANLIYPYC